MNANTRSTAAHEAALPPVKILLSALVWLASRQRAQPDERNLRAMLDQLRRLAVHPQANLDDLRAGLRLAAGAELEVIHWVGGCMATVDPTRH
ncbi:MAG: hypothetical protein MUE86_06275 [Thiobacillaceae bacterium]|jgi:hypothetical protein|nr:hypothetical protein [Thiobacillaceae bacterium]